jgi:hypothetical protein
MKRGRPSKIWDLLRRLFAGPNRMKIRGSSAEGLIPVLLLWTRSLMYTGVGYTGLLHVEKLVTLLR